MNKLTVLACTSIVVLVVSIGFNAYLANQNLTLNNQNDLQETKLEMTSILNQIQVQVNAELHKIGNSVVYACQQLSTLGLNGSESRVVLRELVANSSFIVDAGTANLNNTLVTVEPSTHSNVEGRYIGEQDYMNINSRNPIRPAMTNVLPLVEGFNGVAVVAPVFNPDGVMIGSVSVIFDPGVLLNATIAPAIRNTGYAFTAIQIDGLTIFDTDPTQQGKILFTDPMFANYTELLALGHDIVDESVGYGTYRYYLNVASGQVAEKECYWTTIDIYGVEWRLAIIHALNA